MSGTIAAEGVEREMSGGFCGVAGVVREIFGGGMNLGDFEFEYLTICKNSKTKSLVGFCDIMILGTLTVVNTDTDIPNCHIYDVANHTLYSFVLDKNYGGTITKKTSGTVYLDNWYDTGFTLNVSTGLITGLERGGCAFFGTYNS